MNTDAGSIPADREILFLPDQFLGMYVERVLGRRMHLWLGECHVHAARTEDIDALLASYPEADLLLHPECGCVSQSLRRLDEGELPADRTRVLSTGGMLRHARACASPVDIVGTKTGMLYRLRNEVPGKTFVPLREDAVCSYMKTITVPKLYRALRDDGYEMTVPEPIATRGKAGFDQQARTMTDRGDWLPGPADGSHELDDPLVVRSRSGDQPPGTTTASIPPGSHTDAAFSTTARSFSCLPVTVRPAARPTTT